MIPERFMVTAKEKYIVDLTYPCTDKAVTGWYRGDGGCHTIFSADGRQHPIDPGILEPVGVRPTASMASGVYMCPNCKGYVGEFTHSQCNEIMPYCKWCGQRLDWSDCE